jgi:hypothetical protein
MILTLENKVKKWKLELTYDPPQVGMAVGPTSSISELFKRAYTPASLRRMFRTNTYWGPLHSKPPLEKAIDFSSKKKALETQGVDARDVMLGALCGAERLFK